MSGSLGVVGDVAALAAAGRVEDRVGPSAAAAGPAHRRLARHARRAVVLLRAAHVIGDVAGRRHVVELRRRIVLAGPRLTAVDRDVASAVVGADHPFRVGRVDPHVVVVAVRRPDRRLPRLAAIGGLVELHVQPVDGVLLLRIREDVRVVERALPQVAVLAHPRPRRPGVVRHERAAVLGLDLGVDPVRVGSGHRHADLADRALGHARIPRDLGPGGRRRRWT